MVFSTRRAFKMKIENINIDSTIQQANCLLEEDSALSPGLKASIELLLVIVTLLVNRLGLNSSNSSKPPSTELLQKKKLKKEKDKNGTGGLPSRYLEAVGFGNVGVVYSFFVRVFLACRFASASLSLTISSSRRALLRTLPTSVLGSSFRNSTFLGSL